MNCCPDTGFYGPPDYILAKSQLGGHTRQDVVGSA